MADLEEVEGDDQKKEEDFPFQYPLVLRSDMKEDQIFIIINMLTQALERNGGDIPLTLKEFKTKLDQFYNPSWNVVIGEDFGYKLWSFRSNFVNFALGKVGVLVWKN
ncbi:hypothetical protein M8J76_007467 [Diaphorina citri]|nr:hypothetical protein M8J75_001760 [Diaphorina citri]KAI5740810.1 hypothetical protein M8J76_007467 [Diaphorina citri]KAI5746553.1 hypothetical protein M8J77_004785 [Diaphorina citri]